MPGASLRSRQRNRLDNIGLMCQVTDGPFRSAKDVVQGSGPEAAVLMSSSRNRKPVPAFNRDFANARSSVLDRQDRSGALIASRAMPLTLGTAACRSNNQNPCQGPKFRQLGQSSRQTPVPRRKPPALADRIVRLDQPGSLRAILCQRSGSFTVLPIIPNKKTVEACRVWQVGGSVCCRAYVQAARASVSWDAACIHSAEKSHQPVPSRWPWRHYQSYLDRDVWRTPYHPTDQLSHGRPSGI